MMATPSEIASTWQAAEVESPHLARPVPVVAAKDVAYLPDATRFQTLNLYLPLTDETSALIGSTVAGLPPAGDRAQPCRQVHIHGGAWRDPHTTATTIEPAVAHAFSSFDAAAPIVSIASIDYRLSQFPTHPVDPYDAVKDDHADPAREAVHPDHLSDVLHALAYLRTLGVEDRSFVLTAHSAGACLAMQVALQPPHRYGLENVAAPPRPAAVLGLNGLYDLLELVYGLGAAHGLLGDDYEMMLNNAFGADKAKWPAASPARFDPEAIAEWVGGNATPLLVMVDESPDDQLVPMSQSQLLESHLASIRGLRVQRGHRLRGRHSEPWQRGLPIWDSLQDVLAALRFKSA